MVLTYSTDTIQKKQKQSSKMKRKRERERNKEIGIYKKIMEGVNGPLGTAVTALKPRDMTQL